jgi:hypothetical protein
LLSQLAVPLLFYLNARREAKARPHSTSPQPSGAEAEE